MSNDNPMVTVRTRCNLSEEAVLYPAGAEFDTTLERAEALGDSVTILVGSDKGDEEDPQPVKKSKKANGK